MEKLVNQLCNDIIKISEENNLSLKETIKLMEDTMTLVLDTLVCQKENCTPEKRYVLKFEGYLEEYSRSKMAYSLERASQSAGNRAYMNASDIDLVISDVEKHFENRVVIRSIELRRWVKEALEKNGYDFVLEAYAG